MSKDEGKSGVAGPDPAAQLKGQIEAAARTTGLRVTITHDPHGPTATLVGHANHKADRTMAEVIALEAGFRVLNQLSVLAHPGAEPILANALDLERAGRLEEALAELTRCVSIAPEVPRYLCIRARVLKSLERFEEALADCDRALVSSADDTTEFQRCVLLVALGRDDDAWPVLEKLLSFYEHPDALRLRADLHARRGQEESAARDRDRAIEVTKARGTFARFWPPRT